MPPSRLGVSPEPRVTCEHGWWVPGGTEQVPTRGLQSSASQRATASLLAALHYAAPRLPIGQSEGFHSGTIKQSSDTAWIDTPSCPPVSSSTQHIIEALGFLQQPVASAPPNMESPWQTAPLAFSNSRRLLLRPRTIG